MSFCLATSTAFSWVQKLAMPTKATVLKSAVTEIKTPFEETTYMPPEVKDALEKTGHTVASEYN